MRKDMTIGNPMKIILLFSIPVLLGNIFQQFYNMVDTIIVGRYLGEDALAAVGSTGCLMFLVLGFANGIAQGFGVMISHAFGDHFNRIECTDRACFQTAFALAEYTREHPFAGRQLYQCDFRWYHLYDGLQCGFRYSPWHRRQSDPTVFSDFFLCLEYRIGYFLNCSCQAWYRRRCLCHSNFPGRCRSPLLCCHV